MVLFLQKAMRAIALLGCEGAKLRHRLKHIAARLPPAGPHADICQCRNRRWHYNRSNRQRRCEDTANDPNS
jgi:hypothetical protein